MLTNAPKGTKDLLPAQAYKWHYVEAKWADICKKYGFKEIDRDKLLQIKSNGKNKAAILINSDMKNDNNVKEILLKANIKLDLNQFEIE